MRAVLLVAIALLAGCLTPAMPETVEPLAQETVPWSGETLRLALPAGDSFALLRLDNLHPHEVEGSARYGFVVDSSETGGIVQVEVFHAREDPPGALASAWGTERFLSTALLAYAWAEDPGPLVILVAAYSEKPGVVRLGAWKERQAEVAEEGTPAEWTLTGRAETSYHFSGLLVTDISVQDRSRGFITSADHIPSNGVAVAGPLSYDSAHEGAAVTYARGFGFLLVTGAGVGTIEPTLSTGAHAMAAKLAFAAPSPGAETALAGAAMVAPGQGVGTFTFSLEGVAGLQSILLLHQTAHVDLAEQGVHIEPEMVTFGEPSSAQSCLPRPAPCDFDPAMRWRAVDS